MTDFDLNLVRVFVRLFETTSVTETAAALHVTQPSVSYSLRRLRSRFDDELFRRSGRGLVATPVAEQLYEPLRAALDQIDGAIGRAHRFDPADSDARFTLALSDLGEVTLLPPLIAAAHRVAPGVRFRIRPLDVAQAERQLASGELDAFVATPTIRSPQIARIPLFTEPHIGLVALDHPRLGAEPRTLSALEAERFATVSGPSGHNTPNTALEAVGLENRIALDVTRFAMLPALIEQTDLVGIVPRHAATVFTRTHAVRLLPLPFDTAQIEVAVYTLPEPRRSAAQEWLIGFLQEIIGRLPETTAA